MDCFKRRRCLLDESLGLGRSIDGLVVTVVLLSRRLLVRGVLSSFKRSFSPFAATAVVIGFGLECFVFFRFFLFRFISSTSLNVGNEDVVDVEAGLRFGSCRPNGERRIVERVVMVAFAQKKGTSF